MRLAPALAALVVALTPAAALAGTPRIARPVPDGLRPVGFAGDVLIADDVRGLVAIRPGSTRRVLARRDVRRTVVSDRRLAVVVGGPRRERPGLRPTQTGRSYGDPYDPDVRAGGRLGGRARLRVGERRTLVGPPEGPLTEVARCPGLAAAEITPAVTGDTAAWRACDPTQVVVDRPGGRTTIQADGSVAAIAVDGSRVAWIAVHGLDTPSTLAVTDLASETTRTVDRLLPAVVGDQASVALLGDRIEAVVPDRDDPYFGSCARSVGTVAGPLEAAGDQCEPAALTPGGAIGTRESEGDPRTQVTFTPTGGRPRTLLRASGISSVVGGAGQVAVTRFACRGERLIVLSTAGRGRPVSEPRCPVRLRP